MTVAVGFICSDGVLLASDTLYFGYEKQDGRKFWTLKAGSAIVILGGAGPESGLNKNQRIGRQRLNRP